MLRTVGIIVPCVGIAAILLQARVWSAQPAKHSQLDLPKVERAIEMLRKAKSINDSESRRALVRQATQTLGTKHFATAMLAPLVDGKVRANQQNGGQIDRVIESLTFRPLMEAELPKGFPEFTPVHCIELKKLPGYRKAEVQMGKNGSDNSAFWKLFMHIKRNDIEMTAPVEVKHQEGDNSKVASMAFLYGDPNLGKRGEGVNDENVNVTDVSAQMVVAIGVRGKIRDQAVVAAARKLRAWIAKRKDTVTATGPVRRMGYNSPFVPANRAYFEVQIPVEVTSAKQER